MTFDLELASDATERPSADHAQNRALRPCTWPLHHSGDDCRARPIAQGGVTLWSVLRALAV